MWTNQAVRCMSSKVFIGGVSYQTDDASLREAFGKYGEVVDARIIKDRDIGRSRGFGIVTYATPEEASSAVQALDGQDLHGRRVRVNHVERPPDNFSYGGGDGGYVSANGGTHSGGGGEAMAEEMTTVLMLVNMEMKNHTRLLVAEGLETTKILVLQAMWVLAVVATDRLSEIQNRA